ncbi:MAG: NRDE family protein [Planctomycetota bacterium]|jgi:hypothetical protein
MCVLICRVGDNPLLGANRDEVYDRPFSPPMRWEAETPFWAPRDDTEGGTWIGINDNGLVAAITNLSREEKVDGRASRGHLVAGALARPDLESACAFLDEELSGEPRNPCQIFLMQGPRAVDCVIRPGGHEFVELGPGIHVLSNLHDTDEIVFDLPPDFVLDDLRPILSDTGKNLPRGFAVCKYAGWRGTVASTLIEPGKQFWFAPGPPDTHEYERVL